MSTPHQAGQTISPLHQCMLDDMRMRKLAPKTQSGYIRAVRNLARFLGRSPDTATAEDLRRYQLHLVDNGTSAITINATIAALKFFFEVTARRAEVMGAMEPVRVPHKLPVVLSLEVCTTPASAAVRSCVVCTRRQASYKPKPLPTFRFAIQYCRYVYNNRHSLAALSYFSRAQSTLIGMPS